MQYHLLAIPYNARKKFLGHTRPFLGGEFEQGGTLYYFSYVGSGPASKFHKKNQEFQAPKKYLKF